MIIINLSEKQIDNALNDFLAGFAAKKKPKPPVMYLEASPSSSALVIKITKENKPDEPIAHIRKGRFVNYAPWSKQFENWLKTGCNISCSSVPYLGNVYRLHKDSMYPGRVYLKNDTLKQRLVYLDDFTPCTAITDPNVKVWPTFNTLKIY